MSEDAMVFDLELDKALLKGVHFIIVFAFITVMGAQEINYAFAVEVPEHGQDLLGMVLLLYVSQHTERRQW